MCKIIVRLIILTLLTSVIGCSKTNANEKLVQPLKSESIVTDAKIEIFKKEINVDIMVRDDIQASEAVKIIKPYIEAIKTQNSQKEIKATLRRQNSEMFGNMYF